MIIKIFGVSGQEYSNFDIIELNFTQTVGVPCDSLCFYFKSKNSLEEINQVKAYDGENIIFNGYCDCQKKSQTKDGFENYIYARSSACILVDNEAKPFTYNCPTAKQLWFSLAKGKGFSSQLPQVESSDKYEVTKGTSCFGAIRQFVELKTGKIMFVSPENELKCLEKSFNVRSLNDYSVLSAVSTVNRSEPVSRLCVKKTSDDTDYSLNIFAQICEEMGIDRTQYLNLQALPQWQRENSAQSSLKAYFSDYKTLEVKVKGFITDNLYQRFDLTMIDDSFEDYLLTEKKYTVDENGEMTRLTLKKDIDIKEITYVDK